ncbi:MAG: PKD domain-containing protein, partial [Flavisolibacter sp.]
MKVSLLIFFLCFTLFFGCKKLVDTPEEACFIPYVDFVAHHVNPGTLDVTFTTITSYNGTITSYLWDFGDGTTYSGKTPPPHQYPPPPAGAATATYRIKYTVKNNCGEAFWTNDITVGGCVPDPKFTYAFLNDSTVEFNNVSTATTPVTYVWNFGDGTSSTSSATTVTKTYHQDQNFTVSLKATNGCGDNFYTATVPICRPAVPSQTVTITSCSTVNVNAAATQNGARYQWNFGNGTILPATPGTSSSISYTYPAAGTYNITLSVINAGGCDTATISNAVTIAANNLSGPNTFDYSSDDLEYQFYRPTVTNATTYSWNFGDGTTSSQQNPSKTFNDPGQYTLTIGASNSCGA